MTARARAVTADLLGQLVARLTPRDYAILRTLHQHTVLTSSQVCDLAFPCIRVAERRMRILYLLRAVDRLRPSMWPGSAEFHWVLGEAGVVALAAERGLDVAELGWSHARVLAAVLHSQRREHLVGVNGFFTALVRTARESPGCELVEWWPERRCAAQWGRFVQADAFGVWTDSHYTMRFLLEYDRGTESGTRLLRKLPGYTRLAPAPTGQTAWWLLFRFHSTRREQSARRALVRGTPCSNVATAAVPCGVSPAGRLWLPLREEGDVRRTLAELGA